VNALTTLRWSDLVDIALVSLFAWAAIVWLRRTRARAALAGLAILGAVYFVARQLKLELTAWILQGFFAVLVLVLVVVFQDELRRIFEQIGVLGLRRRLPAPPPDAVEILASVVARLAQTRTGALIVLPGREPLDRHLDGGVALGGSLSEPLLLSLFDTRTPGHDGAVVVDRDVVTRFAVHLPLSTNQARIGPGGTRHAAALGLAERTDALCVVVSEERGTVSLAESGDLRRLASPQQVGPELHRFLARVFPPPPGRASRLRWLSVRWPELLLAVVIAFGAWFLTTSGSGLVEEVRSAPVVVENLPPGYVLERVEPEKVTVTLSGPRHSAYFGEPGTLAAHIDARLVASGRRTFQVTPEAVDPPPGFRVLAVEPPQVRVTVHAASGGGG
jgi:diadenylate cyclase